MMLLKVSLNLKPVRQFGFLNVLKRLLFAESRNLAHPSILMVECGGPKSHAALILGQLSPNHHLY